MALEIELSLSIAVVILEFNRVILFVSSFIILFSFNISWELELTVLSKSQIFLLVSSIDRARVSILFKFMEFSVEFKLSIAFLRLASLLSILVSKVSSNLLICS